MVNAGPELSRAMTWLDAFAAQADLPSDITSKLQVALDEMLSNVFIHGLAGQPEGGRQVQLGLRRSRDRVELEVIDDGPEFDPTGAPVDNRVIRVTERRPGGVGLLFVNTLMDEVRFTRQDGRNRLVMTMRLSQIDRGECSGAIGSGGG